MQLRYSILWILGTIATLLAIIPSGAARPSQSDSNYDHGIIAYSKTSTTDPIAQLQRRMDSGEVTLQSESHLGYLPAILRELKIPVSSQSLVFSKTSFQFNQIVPRRPRALYFNDDVYVGHVQGSRILEFASVDPKLGAVFYSMDEDEPGPPRFQREVYFCLICHDSAAITGGVPGFMTLSVVPDKAGNALRTAPSNAMSDQTPFNERWGGWYVTGTHGKQRHRGNTIVTAGTAVERMDWSKGANLTDLSEHIDTSEYLLPSSDIVALIALTHQTRMHNLMTSASYETQRALHDEETANPNSKGSGGGYSVVTMQRIRDAVEPLVRGMFFVNEAPLTDSVRGVSTFATDFAKGAVRDHKGRSLKDLDLNRRFLRYPLSYLIYSPAFDALPAPVRDYFYGRAREILSGSDSGTFGHLSGEDRAAIYEILMDTKPDFARAAGK